MWSAVLSFGNTVVEFGNIKMWQLFIIFWKNAHWLQQLSVTGFYLLMSFLHMPVWGWSVSSHRLDSVIFCQTYFILFFKNYNGRLTLDQDALECMDIFWMLNKLVWSTLIVIQLSALKSYSLSIVDTEKNNSFVLACHLLFLICTDSPECFWRSTWILLYIGRDGLSAKPKFPTVCQI